MTITENNYYCRITSKKFRNNACIERLRTLEVIFLKRKVVMITGCSSGLGRALCMNFDREKYLVVATARNIDSLDKIPADMRLTLDVCQRESIKTAVDSALKEAGRIDVLINNAGFSARAVAEEIDITQMQKMLDVNVLGMLQMMQEVLPVMRSQRGGRILNIGSISGRMTGIVNGGYCGAKYAVEALSEAARYETVGMGIEVAIIEPGAMETEFFDTLWKNSRSAMLNGNSPYQGLYKRDIAYRQKQNKTRVDSCALKIIQILEKNKLKVRYTVGVPLLFRIFVHLPDSMKELGIKVFN